MTRWISLVALVLLPVSVAMAATITVTEAGDDDPAADNGDCSLREAIIAANTNAPLDGCAAGDASAVDEIVFEAGLDGTTIALSRPGTDEDDGLTGDLDVRESLRIVGNGGINPGFFGDSETANTVISARGIDRVIDLLTIGGQVRLEGLAIIGGAGVSRGGGIRSSGATALVMDNVLVTGNTADSSALSQAGGGGISAAGGLTLRNSAVYGNTVMVGGSDAAMGGGIDVAADVTITGSLVVNNMAQTEAGTASGGGIWFDSPGSITITDAAIAQNEAAVTTGGGATARGGGAYLTGGGDASLSRVTVSSNDASAAADGTARQGGLAVSNTTLSLENCTLYQNEATSGTGTARSGALGVVSTGSANLNNVTVLANEATSGTAASGLTGGLRNTVGSALTLSNTAVAGNTDSAGSSPDCAGPVTSAGYNLLGDNTGCSLSSATGDQVGDVAGGGTAIDASTVFNGAGLDVHGGGYPVGDAFIPQITVVLAAGSPALDAGDPNDPGSGGTCAVADQRGEARPADGNADGSAVCDVGAVEGTNTLPRASLTGGTVSVDEQAGTRVVSGAVRLSVPYNEAVTVDVTVDAAASVAEVPGDFTYSPATVSFEPGQTEADLEITVVDDDADEADETAVLALASPTNAVLGMPSTLTVVIPAPAATGGGSGGGGGGAMGIGLLVLLFAGASGRVIAGRRARPGDRS